MQIKIIFLTFCLLAVAASQPTSKRRERDVSELSQNYLPPSLNSLVAEEPLPETTTPLSSEIVTELTQEALADAPELKNFNGYEYRTVRRLKYRHRQRRDVSHLSEQYLPPKSQYLPPPQQLEQAAEPQADEKIEEDSEIVEAPLPKVASEYLPPNEISTEATPVETESPPESLSSDDAPIDEQAALRASDGYHYQQPEVPLSPELKASKYLPPLKKEAIEVEGPEGGESAVLAADGYHYRKVKRVRF